MRKIKEEELKEIAEEIFENPNTIQHQIVVENIFYSK